MPGISPIKPLLQVFFYAEQLTLPTGWDNPSEDKKKKQYGNSHPDREKMTPPKLIPPWFKSASSYKLHQETADKIGENFKEFAEKAVDEVKNAHQTWKGLAKFKDLKVMSVCAIGTPGCLDGPELKGLMSAWQGTKKNEKAYIKAVKTGVSKAFKNWQGKVMVPGLPWYPAFAAFPGPMAPPMPNVPMPLITCISAKMTDIVMGSTMKKEMVNAFDSGLKKKDEDKQHEALFKCIADVLALAFLMWLPSQQVMNVMGKGPIPIFAPPYVPVGPVVGGDNLPIPGHLAA